MEKCTKTKEIERMEKAIYGNGKEGLLTLVSNLYEKYDTMDKNLMDVRTDIKVLLQFQTQVEATNQQKQINKKDLEKKEREEKINQRWRIGLTITTILGLLGLLVSIMITTLDDKNTGVSEQEFQELWKQYKDNHVTRSANDTIRPSI